jgi:glycosyltransferase involved in cell wall biosynthesis
MNHKEKIMNSKKILAIVGATVVSGAEIVSLSVIKGLKEKGFDVFCVVNRWNDGDFIQRLEKIGVPYKAIKLGWYYISKPLWSMDSLIHYPKALYQYYRLQKKFNPDVIYVTSFRPIILLFPLLRKKIIYYAQDSSSKERRITFIKIADKKVEKFIACSRFIKEDLIKCGINENKIEVIYNGVELYPNAVKIKNRENNVRVGIVGQVIPRKGHHLLIEALKLLNDEGIKNFELYIFGGGSESYINEIKEKITEYSLTDKVTWKGIKKDLNEIYPFLDVVVVPTVKDEPFGLVAAEPAAWNIPAIVSNTGGLKEIIRDGESGLLFENENFYDLAEKLKLLISSEELRSAMGSKAKEIVAENFTTKIQTNKMEKLINEIL